MMDYKNNIPAILFAEAGLSNVIPESSFNN